MKKIIVIVIILILLITGVLIYLNLSASSKNKSDNSDKTQMANPASVYCVDNGGKLEIRESGTGQYGECVFPDGRECEEWDFYNTKVCQ